MHMDVQRNVRILLHDGIGIHTLVSHTKIPYCEKEKSKVCWVASATFLLHGESFCERIPLSIFLT